jgi:multiple sugar transport system permease protein
MAIAGHANRTKYLIGAICCFVIALMLFPLIVSLFASIKTPAAAQAVPPTYLPWEISLQNYRNFADYQAGIWVYVTNSLQVAFLTIILSLLLSVPAGYGLARFPIPGKEVIFLLLLAGLMIPYQALLTPLMLVFNKLGLQQTHFGLALIHTALQMPFSVYLMRNSFEAVPKDLEEAAMIDGCGSFERLIRIFLPAVVPGMTTVALFAFIHSWNEFLAALIFMNSESSFTVPVMLVASRSGSYGAIDWGMLQAGVIISILPCAALYVFLQKYYVSGFLSGAIK